MKTGVALIAAVACGFVTVLLSPVAEGQPKSRHNRIVDLLSRNQVVFGWFTSAKTPEAAKRASEDKKMDFIFFNMEAVASYKPEEVKAFMEAMSAAGLSKNPNEHPLMALMTRLPIFHDDPAAARARTAEMLNLGVDAIVFPDMESAEEAEQAIAAMRYAGARPEDEGWP